MRFAASTAFGLILLAPALDEPRPQRSPAEQVRDLDAEHLKQLKDFSRAFQSARTDGEKQAALKDRYPDQSAYAARYWKVARDHPGDPAAVDALVWVACQVPDDPLSRQAVDLLLKDHPRDARIGPLCHRIATHAKADESIPLLRKILADNPHREVKGLATFALGWVLKDRLGELEGARVMKTDPALLAKARAALGEEAVARLLGDDPAAMRQEVERLFTRAIADYGDLKYYHRRWGTLADAARAELEEIRGLAVGKPAPEIAGEDVEGRPLTLSGQKGKVVVLTFWATWCGPCMAMVPDERALAERFKGRPFVLLGINGDDDRAAAKRAIAKERMTWQSWWQGGQDGPISERWNVFRWPTVYVIDANGLIRHRDFHGEALEKAVDALLKEMKTGG